METEREVMLQVDSNGWVQVPGDIGIKPPLPGGGRVLGLKHWDGSIHVIQESTSGPKLYRLSSDFKSWEEISAVAA